MVMVGHFIRFISACDSLGQHTRATSRPLGLG